MNAVLLYRLSNFFYRYKMGIVAKFFVALNYFLHNSYIPASCKIGRKSVFAYKGIGVVIHGKAEIGDECLIGQGITIGGKGGDDDLPKIENNVYIGAGVRILGGVKIGHHTIIAPNSVVLNNVEPYSVIGGIPAKLISHITKDNFEQKYRLYYGQNDYMK